MSSRSSDSAGGRTRRRTSSAKRARSPDDESDREPPPALPPQGNTPPMRDASDVTAGQFIFNPMPSAAPSLPKRARRRSKRKVSADALDLEFLDEPSNSPQLDAMAYEAIMSGSAAMSPLVHQQLVQQQQQYHFQQQQYHFQQQQQQQQHANTHQHPGYVAYPPPPPPPPPAAASPSPMSRYPDTMHVGLLGMGPSGAVQRLQHSGKCYVLDHVDSAHKFYLCVYVASGTFICVTARDVAGERVLVRGAAQPDQPGRWWTVRLQAQLPASPQQEQPPQRGGGAKNASPQKQRAQAKRQGELDAPRLRVSFYRALGRVPLAKEDASEEEEQLEKEVAAQRVLHPVVRAPDAQYVAGERCRRSAEPFATRDVLYMTRAHFELCGGS